MWPLPQNPSSTENNGILLDLHNNQGAMAYGIDELERRNPLAWPGFATEDDVNGLVPTIIQRQRCDPLRDEGMNFYRLLLRGGRAGALPAGHGHDPRHRDLPDRMSRDQPRYRRRDRRLLSSPGMT